MSYIPDRGDFVMTDFDPQAGHEQAGPRPALVLSQKLYNSPSGLAICCPITSRQKGYPFEVLLPSNLSVYGVVLVDQIKSLDWSARPFAFLGKAPAPVLQDVLEKLNTLLS
ncbi:MAG: endoribonuclease MazF [Chloroflexi bacterium]|nr:endoribonuclease MazF [Chloroflexota bacterium]